ncbi:General transcription factor IIH subunit like [Actinidia chinensis var. chinensis]|uniref:General transcription factor IIH subunit like n=1 Tax=Actinidia chinensis var. chinensis TaxID=1590841 RepID=A0A2R6R0Q3_ACTCC|nr:General transcription factor IIH subunit like [Actinidia chinensis var. chinensis]
MKNGYASPSSSPPTPPSPLPISVGPGRQKYFFSSSPSPSPPFSPPPSSHTSADKLLPLLHDKGAAHTVPLAFSLDRPSPDESDSKRSCLKDLLEWLVLRCCNSCSLSL